MCPQGQKGLRRYDLERHKQSSNSIKRYGVALMFLRAHGRKSMPVCLETLLFLCSFVLMFSALAANLIECHILQHLSSYLRLTQCYIALLLHQFMPQSHGSERLLCPSYHAVALRVCSQAHYSESRTVRP